MFNELEKVEEVVIGNPVEPLERADFLRLASVCGLRLSPTDLFQLERHKLLCALDVSNGLGGVDADGTYYSALHLYVLATYLDGVRAYRHPWSSISGEREHDEIELDELGARCREIDAIIVGLSQDLSAGEGGGDVDSQSVVQHSLDIERYAHGIDPFGPLSGIVDMMRADVVGKLRGAGRLYGELRRMAAGLAVLADRLSEADAKADLGRGVGVLTKPKMRETVRAGFEATADGGGARSAGVTMSRSERAGDPPTIAITIDEVPVDDLRRTQLIERMEGAESRAEGVELLDEFALASGPITAALSDDLLENEDPIAAALSAARGGVGQDAPRHGFGRDESATSRTVDLNARLERLRRQDFQQLTERSESAGSLGLSGLDDALSEALDGAVEDVLGDALEGMMDGAQDDAEGNDGVFNDAELNDAGDVMIAAEGGSGLLENDLFGDEELVEYESSEAVVLEDELLDPRLIQDESSDAIVLENEVLEGAELVENESSDAVVLENEVFEGAELVEHESSEAVVLELDDELLENGLEYESEVLESGPSYTGEELSEKIAELNRLREQYLAAQAWSQLVELYEDGIDLFVDSNERQQVYLVLGTLYEIKLKEKGRAMDAFIRAFGEVGNQAGTDKALAGMRRLGPSPEVHDGYLASLEEQLAGDLEDGDRRYLQRFHALALYGAGEYQRAFLLYASMLAENPDENVNPQSLADLELLGAEVDIEELLDFYHDILEQNVRPEIRQWVQYRVEAL